jgi:conjugal transfer pilus assembly protein TraE
MLIKHYKYKLDRLRKKFTVTKFTSVVQAVVIIFLVYTIVERTNTQKTVFLPPQKAYKEFWVSGNQLSKSYKEMVGIYISYTLLNIQKNNIESSLANLMPFVDSSSYKDVTLQLKKIYNYIAFNNVSRTFYYSYTKYPIIGNQKFLYLYGSIKDTIQDKVISTKKIILKIGYKVDFGMFKIKSIDIEEDK